MSLDLSASDRRKFWIYLSQQLEEYYSHTGEWKVTPGLDKKDVLAFVRKYDFSEPLLFSDAVDHVMDGFRKYHVHTPHPHYMGLFNPRTSFPSIAGDTMAATINPQMAAWSHAPFGIEVENYIISLLGSKFGFGSHADGVFTSGGAEANLTALCCALQSRFPEIKKKGIRSLKAHPRIYCSSEAHHSIQKAAVITGIGTENVIPIEVDAALSMKTDLLDDKIKKDLSLGYLPFLVVATAGTTGAGAFDDLNAVRRITRQYKLWMHTDAAYGGACALTKNFRYLLEGVELSDSITFDAHKWLSVPMGAGIFITPDREILRKTFDTVTAYMPSEARELDVIDPYTHSIQWSRRFTALKLYLSLLVLGWEGYQLSIEGDIETGDYLRKKLKGNGWKILNETMLPIVCFTREGKDRQWITTLISRLVKKGQMWLSTYPVNGILCGRACITNYNTREPEIDTIVEMIEKEVAEMDSL